MKQNIATLDNPLAKLHLLRGVTFTWRQDEYPDMDLDSARQIGMIAQEVEQVYPELVKTNDDGMKSIAYDKFTAVLLEAVKAQQKQIEDLQARIEALEY